MTDLSPHHHKLILSVSCQGGPKPDSVDGIWEGCTPEEAQQVIQDSIWLHPPPLLVHTLFQHRHRRRRRHHHHSTRNKEYYKTKDISGVPALLRRQADGINLFIFQIPEKMGKKPSAAPTC
jgi:hypothetical protein